MVELHSIYVALYASGAVLALVVSAAACWHRTARGAPSLAAMMLGVAIWSGATAAMWSAPTLDQQVFWSRTMQLGIWLVPVGFLTLVCAISHMDRWRTRGRIALLSIVTFALANLQWLNPGHLYDTEYIAHTVGSHTSYVAVQGPLFWAFAVVSYGQILAGLVIIFRVLLRSSGAERTQAAILFAGGLAPFIASALTESRSVPLGGLDLAPLVFLATGAVWLIAILRGTMFDILPRARVVLVEQMPDGVVVLDGHGLAVDANPAALKLLQRPAAEVLHRSAEAVFGNVKGAAALLAGSGPRHAELPINSDGDSKYVHFSITPLVAGAGGPPPHLVTLHDMTERRRNEDGLRLASRVFDTANEGIVVGRRLADGETDHKIVEVNEAFCRLTGRSRDDTLGRTVKSLLSDAHLPKHYEAMEKALRTTGTWKGEVRMEKADGTAFPAWLSITFIGKDQEDVASVVGVFTDLTEIRQAQEQLEYDATHDALTGLASRSLLSDRLEHALARARRAGGTVAVLFLDLDNFKGVNDTLGHAQGDRLLVEVSERILGVLREADSAGRHGGDEFTVIIADAESPLHVKAVAERLLDAITSRCYLDSDDVHMSSSIGVALFPSDGTDAATLIQHADVAMYSAKRLGRNQAQFYSEDLQLALERSMIVEKELWGALAEKRYFLLYQPQVDLSTGQITGVEALVRLRSRDGTVLSPTEFIPVAEDSELIVRLGDWVVRAACAELATFQEIVADLTMSVNFSARQFRDTDLTSLLQDVLRTSRVEARSLEIEITETAFLTDPPKAAAKLKDLRDVAGIRLSLDDFGTGYSSLTYVRMFRTNTIKIDCGIVGLLPDDRDAQSIVLSIIALAKSLEATVIAEGPETEEQVRFLRANGCDRAQGFYFSRPVSADEIMFLLRKGPFQLPVVGQTV